MTTTPRLRDHIIRAPPTLLTINKDVRFLIWDEAFGEVHYVNVPWCDDCGTVQREIGHKKSTKRKGYRCNGDVIWLCQPSSKEIGLLFISKKLHQETLAFFRRALIVFHKPTSTRRILFRGHVRDDLKTLNLHNGGVACHGPGEFLAPGIVAYFTKLKIIVLENELLRDSWLQTLPFLIDIQGLVKTKAVRAGDNHATSDIAQQKSSNTFAATATRDWVTMVLEGRNIKVQFPVMYTITAFEVMEWPFFVDKKTWLQHDMLWSKAFNTRATWDENKVTFPAEGVADLSKEWWFEEWLARRNMESTAYYERKRDDVWPFGHLAGDVWLRSGYSGERWGSF
ncbi:hypothetical protein H2200_008317 [Cladophialophora chaetospira]|uniref:Uncharacterized protein n=1 Tax=Cladophialophora chaetospira TaxID=386627 RepID=A0AA38X5J4_9EURO|nr:hypothetical protein H2200_008317 [Cladophialophora chaetospira]